MLNSTISQAIRSGASLLYCFSFTSQLSSIIIYYHLLSSKAFVNLLYPSWLLSVCERKLYMKRFLFSDYCLSYTKHRYYTLNELWWKLHVSTALTLMVKLLLFQLVLHTVSCTIQVLVANPAAPPCNAVLRPYYNIHDNSNQLHGT